MEIKLQIKINPWTAFLNNDLHYDGIWESVNKEVCQTRSTVALFMSF
jgi:hypothetical protein